MRCEMLVVWCLVFGAGGCCGVPSGLDENMGSPTGPEIRLAFDGAGTTVSNPFVLRRGTVHVSVQKEWPRTGSEHFSVHLMRMDGSPILGGLIVNEAMFHDDPVRSPIQTTSLVRVRPGDHAIQVKAAPGSPWSVQVLQR